MATLTIGTCCGLNPSTSGRCRVTIRLPSAWSRTVVGIRLPEEDLAMSDRPDEQGGSEPDVVDDDEIAAKMRAVMRAQEIHREGGVDPELEVTDADPGPA